MSASREEKLEAVRREFRARLGTGYDDAMRWLGTTPGAQEMVVVRLDPEDGYVRENVACVCRGVAWMLERDYVHGSAFVRGRKSSAADIRVPGDKDW